MLSSLALKRTLAGLLIGFLFMGGTVQADSAQDRFYKAYYIEQTQRDWARAAELYEEVASDRRADGEIRAKAKARLAACREELASTDFARLGAVITVRVNQTGLAD